MLIHLRSSFQFTVNAASFHFTLYCNTWLNPPSITYTLQEQEEHAAYEHLQFRGAGSI